MDKAISIRRSRPEELEWINARYNEIRFAPSTASDILVIAEVDGERAGVGRVCTIDDHNAELGGILVLEPFRGRGVAARIVADLLRRSHRFDCVYCLPYAHLCAFYKSFDFQSPQQCGVNPPAHITSKLAWCLEEYDTETTLLARTATPEQASTGGSDG